MSDFEPIKINFDIPAADVARDTESVEQSFSDVDKSVEKAERRFNAWVQAQLKSGKVMGDSVQTTQKYNSVLSTLERRMAKTQDPKLVQAYANAINKLKKEVATLGQKAPALQPMKRQFDGLGNSINMITRDLPAFAFSAQTGFMAISNNIPMLADEIGRLTARNKELLASGQQTKPVWKQVLGSLLSWQTALSMGIVLLTVYGKEIGNWISSLFNGAKALDKVKMRVDALNDAFKSTSLKKASKEVLELKALFSAVEKGHVSKEKALKKYNETLGKVAGTTDNYAKAERTLLNQSDDYLKMLVYKKAAFAALASANDKIVENETKRLSLKKELEEAERNVEKFKEINYTDGVVVSMWGTSTISPRAKVDAELNSAKAAISKVDKELKELENSSVNLFNGLLKNAKEIANKNNFKLFSEDDNNGSIKTVNSRKQLLEKLASLDREYAVKSYAKDEQELQALRAKFDKMRTEIAKFNANPKNRIKIDGSQLDEMQQKAESNLLYRQETKRLSEQLKEQKKLFEDYENYKTKFGKEKADERYQNSIGEVKNYGDFLSAEIAKLQTGSELTGVEKERLQILLNAQKQYNDEQQQLYDEQLADLISYDQKRKAMVEKFNEVYG